MPTSVPPTPGREEIRHYLLFVLAWAVIQAALVAFRASAALHGELIDPDSYMRLVRVAQLSETGSWFDADVIRSNAPYGETLHWTRPLDVLLLAGAWLLAPFLGFREGLFWAGALVGPLLLLAACLAVPWATAPLLDPERRRLAVLAVLAQPAVTGYALLGRADHHPLILLAFILAIGWTARVLTQPAEPRLAVAAGIATGFGIWVSVEFLLVLVVALGTTTMLWLARPDRWARTNVHFAAAVTGTVGLGLLLERPPDSLGAVVYDRLSVVHLAACLVAVSVWGVARVLERSRWWPDRVGARGIMLAVGGLGGAALLLGLFPGVFRGPMADVEPELATVWLPRVEEFRPLLLPTDLAGLGRFLAYLGPVVVTVPFLVWLLARERRSHAWNAWVYLGLGLVVFVPLALLRARFAIYAEVPLAVVLVGLLGRVLRRLDSRVRRPWRTPARAVVAAGFLAGFLGLGWTVQAVARARPTVVTSTGLCPLPSVSRELESLARAEPQRPIVLAFHDFGPELLYRTSVAVLGTPYHGNGAGILDARRMLAATDPAESRVLAEERGIDFVLLCPRGVERTFYDVAPEGETLYRRLATSQPPEWLQPLELSRPAAAAFLLYRVVR